MHVALNDLLAARDGEPVRIETQRHLERCGECRAEIARLEELRAGLQALPAFEVPDELWSRLQLRVAKSRRAGNRVAWVAVAASIVIAAGLGLLRPAQEDTAIETDGVVATGERGSDVRLAPEVENLVSRSIELERALRSLPARPSVERAATATTIDGLERRIAWLDHQLSYANEAGLTPAQSRRLWNERVVLLDSLVMLRYVEAPQWDF